MKKDNSKKKIAGVILPSASVVALAISLPIALTNLLHNELDSNNSQTQTKQLSSNLKANNGYIASDGSTDLLPKGSQIVTLPQWYSTSENPNNWNGSPQKQTLQSNQYSIPSSVNLNVYSPTSLQAIVAIPKEYAESSNFALNFYWTFLGNSKSLGLLKNTDDANPNNRNGLGTVLPNSWVTNTLYKTPDGQYRLMSKLNIPQEYAPYFYNDHQGGNWQSMGLDTVAQYFNLVLNEGRSSTIGEYSTNANSVLQYTSKKQYILRVKTDGISSKTQIQFENNLDPTTDYIQGQPITLKVNPFNVNAGKITKDSNDGVYKYQYQWYLNDKPISDTQASIQNKNSFTGTTTNTLTINNPDGTLNGKNIYCKVTGPILDTGYDGNSQNLKQQKINSSSVPSSTSSNVTTLNEMTDFTISSVNLSISNSSAGPNSDANLIPQGQLVTLTANAIINPIYDKYVTYQWFHNGKQIQDQTNKTLVLTNVTQQNSGTYYCQASLNYNNTVIQTVKSNTRKINVVVANNFSIQLAFNSSYGPSQGPSSTNETINLQTNSNAEFYAVPYLGGESLYGNSSVSYQWYKDGIAIPDEQAGYDNPNVFYGANSNILQNLQALPNSSGAYTCVATYKYPNGQTITATSNTIFLNVTSMNQISIYKNLQNVTVESGESVTLTIGASCNGNSNGLSYTWQYMSPNGVEWNTISNQTQNTLTLNPTQTLDANGYSFRCQVSSQSGWNTIYTTSNTATISVNTPNVKILSNPISIKNAKLGSNQVLSVEAVIDKGNNNYQTSGLSYQWCTVDNNNKISPISGATQQSYTIQNITGKDNNTQYMVYVYPTNSPNPKESGKSSSVATVTVLQPAINPSSLTITGNTNVMVGGSTTFTINPKLNYDELPQGYSLKYQWYKSNGNQENYTAISGATSNTLSLSQIKQSQNSEMYWCKVSIMQGNEEVNSQNSRPVILNVNGLDAISIQLPSSVKAYVGGNATITGKVSIDGKEPTPEQKVTYQWKVSKNNQNNSKEVTWEDIDQANSLTLTLNNVDMSSNGNLYALQVNVDGSSFISSFPTTLEVFKSSYIVNLDSTNVIVNEKQTATIKANVTQIFNTNETTYKYQWYVLQKGVKPTKDESGNITNGTIISGATKETLTLANSLSSWNGAQFYCQVTLGSQVQTSQLATLDVKESVITANQLPYRIVASNGKVSVQIDNVKTSFDIPGASLHYQWQECTDGKTWKDMIGKTSSSLSLSNLKTSDNGDGYRVVITYSDNSTTYETYTSNPTTLIVNSNVNVSIEMQDTINAKIGSTLVINPKVDITGTNISNEVVTYQWQKFDLQSGKWNNYDGQSNNSSLSLPTIQQSNNGDKYRLIVNVGSDSFTSESVTIKTCQNSFDVINSTNMISTIIGGNVDASVSVNQLVGENANYTYQWYASYNGQEPALISGQNTNKLHLENAQKNWDGAKFYCVVTDPTTNESIQSKDIELKINQVDILNTDLPPQVLSQNGTATLQIKNATTSYQIDNIQLSYQWYVCNPGEDNWTAIEGNNTNTLTLSGLTSKDNGKLYKCLISYGDYAQEYSNVTILTVNSSINVDIQLPSQINGSVGQNVVIDPKIQISGNNLGTYTTTYQWQSTKTPDDEDSWKNVEAASQEKLTLNSIKTEQSGTSYRLIVTINGNTFTSGTIQLNVVNTPFVVNVTTDKINANIGSNINLTVTVSQLVKDDSDGKFTYKWYVVPKDSKDNSYVALPDKFNSATITLNNVQLDWDGAKFYCVVSDGDTFVNSDPISLSINPNSITYDQLPPVTIANDSKATINLENVNPGYNIDGVSLTYVWQVNTGDGKGWQNWTKQTSQRLELEGLTYLENGYSFRCQITYGTTVVYTNSTTLIVNSTANVSILVPTEVNGYKDGSVSFKPTVTISGNNINPSEAKYQWQYAIASNNGSFSWNDIKDASQKDLTIGNLQTTQNGNVYRLVVTIAGQTFTSNLIKLNVYDSPFVANVNTTSQNVQIGGNFSLTANVVENYQINNSQYTYQWYATQNPDSLENTKKLEGYTTSNLDLKNAKQDWNGWYFYCVVSNGNISQKTQLSQLKIIPDNIQVSNLSTTTVVQNSQAVIEVKNATPNYVIRGASIKYQWQVYQNGKWENLQSQTNSTLSLTGLDSTNNGQLYRCEIVYSDDTNTYSTVYTNSTSIIVNSTVNVNIAIPKFVNTYVNGNVVLKPNINIDGTNLGNATPSYQWQKYNSSNQTWENVQSNSNTSQLTLSKINQSNNGDQYRLTVSLNGLKFVSDSTTLKVYDSSFAVNVAQQVVNTNIAQQFELSVNVNQLVGDEDTFTYQWYVKQKGQSEPVEIKDQNNSTIVLKDPQQSWDGAQFYCVVTSNTNKTQQQSQEITLRINQCNLEVPDLPTISVVKDDKVTINLGEVKPSYIINGAQITYQWQKYNSTRQQWEDVGGQNNNSLVLSGLDYLNNGDMYRCVVNYGSYATAYSLVTTLVVNTNWNVNIEVPNQVNTSIGQNATLKPTISVEGENLGNNALKNAQYQWQINANGTWQNVEENGNNPELNIQHVTKEMNGEDYRLVLSVGGNTFTSSTITLKVFDTLFTVNTDKTIINTNIGQDQLLTLDINNTYDSGLTKKYTYQWYYYLVNQNNENGEGTKIEGATNATLRLTNPQLSWSSVKFYCKVSSNGETQKSPTITLSINPDNIYTVDLPTTVTATDGKATIKVTGAEVSYEITNAQFSYQWYQLIGDKWTEMTGQTSDTLNLNSLTSSDNGNSYRCVVTYNSGPENIYSTYTTNTTTVIVNASASVDIKVPSQINVIKDGKLSIEPDVTINSNASNAEIKYQWQYIDPKSLDSNTKKWIDVPDGNSKNLVITKVPETANEYSFRLLVSVGGSTFTSNSVKINIVDTSFVVNANATSYTVNAGSNVTLSVDVTTTVKDNSYENSEPTYQYQWYYADPIYAGGPNASDEQIYKFSTPIEGQNTNKLVLKDVNYDYDRFKFFCKVTQVIGEQKTEINGPIMSISVNKVQINVPDTPSIVFARNSEATIMIKGVNTSYDVSGAQLRYQWYNIVNGEKTPIYGATNSTLSLKGLTSSMNGSVYVCEISYVKGDTVYATVQTEPTSIVVNTTMDVTIYLPDEIKAVIGGAADIKPNISIKGDNLGYATPIYQWQYVNPSNISGGTSENDLPWQNIEDYYGKLPELDITKVTKEMNGYIFRLQVKLLGNTFTSNPIELTVSDSSFTVNVNTNNVNSGIGQTTSINVTVSQNIKQDNDEPYTYQWYVITNDSQIGSDGKLNGNLIEGATSAVLNFKDIKESWNGTKYYCVVKKGEQEAVSKLVSLNVKPVVLSANNLPIFVNVTGGKTQISVSNVATNYTIKNTQITYQWQKLNDDNEWENVPLQTNSTLNLTNLSAKDNGSVYRCMISYGNYATMYTSTTTLVVNMTMNISVNLPSQINGLLNSYVTIVPNVSVNGDNVDTSSITYQWKVAKNTNSYALDFTDVPGEQGKQAQLTLDNLADSENGNWYQLVVNLDGNEFTSNPIQLNVLDSSFTVNVNNDDIEANLGSDVTMTAKVDTLINDQSNNYKYQWYVVPESSNNSYSTRSSLKTGYATYASQVSSKVKGVAIVGANSPTLSIEGVNSQMNGAQFYCEVSLGNEKQYTPPINFEVNECEISFESLPIVYHVEDGKAILKVQDVKVSYEIPNCELSYQWQISDDNGDTWNDIEGQNTNQLELDGLTHTYNGYSYRCVISYGAYVSKNTSPTVLIVQPQTNNPITPPNSGDDNTITPIGHSGPSAWIAIPIVFGSIAAISAGLAIWWFAKKRNNRWGV